MRFVTFAYRGAEQPGVLAADGGGVVSLRNWDTGCADLRELIERYDDAAAASIAAFREKEKAVPLADIKLLAPLPHPRHDMICVGLNYIEHAKESAIAAGREYKTPTIPVYFSKRVGVALGQGDAIHPHGDITSQLDYETELAIVVGKTCDHVKPEDVYGHIFGYTIINDVSARDLQHRHMQYYFGKSLDGFTPMGPWIVTADELPAPGSLRLTTRVNGEIRQNSSTGDFIFDIPYLISQLSSGIVLEPGEVIATGTPPGVGMGMTPPRFLLPGDVVECEIEGIGVLRNMVGE